MLDRLPTELLERVIDETSYSIWTRKAMLDSLSLVSKSYRRAVAAVSDCIVYVDRTSAVGIIKQWPATKRKLVTTVLVGSYRPGTGVRLDGDFHLNGMHRILAALPNVKHFYLRNLSFGTHTPASTTSLRMEFHLCADNPLQKCLSLSISATPISLRDSVDRICFAARRLHLTRVGCNMTYDESLPRLLLRNSLPHLELLRLSGQRLPECSAAFLDCLGAIQVDMSADSAIRVNADCAFLKTNTPVLFALDPPPGIAFAGSLATSLHCIQVKTRKEAEFSPLGLHSLRAVFCTVNLDEPPSTTELLFAEAIRNDLEMKLVLATVASGHRPIKSVDVVFECPAMYDFVQPAFLEYLQTLRNEQRGDP